MSGGRACWCEWSAEHAGVSGGRAAGVSGVQSMLVCEWSQSMLVCEWSAEHAGVSGVQSMLV